MPKGELVQRLGNHDTVSGLVGWDADSAVISTYDYAGTVRRFRAANGEMISATALELPGISSLCTSPDGALLAATAPHTLAFFDAATLERRETISLKVKGIYGLAWRPDGTAIACSADDGRVRIWQLSQV